MKRTQKTIVVRDLNDTLGETTFASVYTSAAVVADQAGNGSSFVWTNVGFRLTWKVVAGALSFKLVESDTLSGTYTDVDKDQYVVAHTSDDNTVKLNCDTIVHYLGNKYVKLVVTPASGNTTSKAFVVAVFYDPTVDTI